MDRAGREISRIDKGLGKLAATRSRPGCDAREWLHATEAVDALLDERLVWMRARDAAK